MNNIESMNCLRKRFKLTKVILLNFDHSDDSTRHNVFVIYAVSSMIVRENIRILRNKSHASAMRIEWVKIKKVYQKP